MVSESLRQTRDEEVEAIAEEAYRGAYRVLSDHRDLLDTIAERLLANEVIEREEIQELMATGRAAPEPSTEPVVEPARGSGARAEALASELPAPPEDD